MMELANTLFLQVIVSTAVSSGIDYQHRWNGTVVGTVATRSACMHDYIHVSQIILALLTLFPSSLPPVSLPRPNYMLASLPDAILIAVVTFVTSISAANLLAKKFNYTIDSSQVHLFTLPPPC